MSDVINPGLNFLGRLASEPMLLAPSFNGVSATVNRMLAGTNEEVDYLDQYASLLGDERAERKPYAFSGGMAIIPVHGTLLNRFSGTWGFVTGYDYIRGAFDAALADSQVQGIVLDTDSYGGEVHGCFELSDHIYANRGKKPVVAVVNANCYSAAYATASAADRIIVTPSGGAGSIGVVTMHVDYSKALAENGIKVSFIFAGKHKVDGNPYEPLPDDVRADIQARIDATYEKFVATVARNRGLDVKKVRGTEARTFNAEDAKALGLIDSVAAPKAAFAAFANELSGSPSKDFKMENADTHPQGTETETPAAALEAAAPTPASDIETNGASAERQRIAAILNCEEAADRPALANHMALNTDLSVEQARKLLAVSAKEAKVAATPFQAAMDAGSHPEVGADVGEESQPEVSVSQRIIANFQKATGMKLN